MSMSTETSPSLAAAPAPRTKGRNIVAIASGKGGVGKTWFSITLAHALARLDQRALLFDADLGLANLDIQLGLMPKNDIGGVISGKISLAQAVQTMDEGDFDVIAGRSGSGALANQSPGRLQTLLDDVALLSASYDKVLLDLGAGVERTVRQFTHHAGMVVVVTTDEPTSLTDAYAFVKLTHAERPETDVRVVVNMVASTKEGERTYNTLLKACEGFLKFSPPLLGIVRRDRKVADAIRAQVPLLTRHPNTEAAADVEAIAKKLID